MVYKSPVQNIYYQGTSGGRPNTPRTNELEQVANALSNFEKDFRSFGKSYVNNKQKIAQNVFEQLKAEGITDPDEIKELIKNGDPRVKGLDSQYAAAVTDVNFGIAHAMQDRKSIEENVVGQNLAKINLDEQFESVNRTFDGMSSSYIRGYNEIFDKFRIDINGKKLEADALQLIKDKQGTFYTQLDTSLAALDNNKDRLEAVEMLIQTKEEEGFLSFDQMNDTVLDYLDNQVDIFKTVGADPETLDFIVSALTSKRGKNKQLPSFLDNKDTAEKSIKILNEIYSKSSEGLSTMDFMTMMIAEPHKLLKKGDKDKAILGWQTLITNQVDDAITKNIIPEEQRDFWIMNGVFDKTKGFIHPEWKNALEIGFNAVTPYDFINVDRQITQPEINKIELGLKHYKFLRSKGQAHLYLSDDQKSFYNGVEHLTTAGKTYQEAISIISKTLTDNIDNKAIPNAMKMEIESSLDGAFNGFFADKFGGVGNYDIGIAMEKAMALAEIYYNFGMPLEAIDEEWFFTGNAAEGAVETALNDVINSFSLIDNVLVPNAALENKNPKVITERSRFIAERWVEENNVLDYDADDIFLKPIQGGWFVLSQKNTQMPVIQDDGTFVYFSASQVLDDYTPKGVTGDMTYGQSERQDKYIDSTLENTKAIKNISQMKWEYETDQILEDLLASHARWYREIQEGMEKNYPYKVGGDNILYKPKYYYKGMKKSEWDKMKPEDQKKWIEDNYE